MGIATASLTFEPLISLLDAHHLVTPAQLFVAAAKLCRPAGTLLN